MYEFCMPYEKIGEKINVYFLDEKKICEHFGIKLKSWNEYKKSGVMPLDEHSKINHFIKNMFDGNGEQINISNKVLIDKAKSEADTHGLSLDKYIEFLLFQELKEK